MAIREDIFDIIRNKNTQIPTLPVIVENVLNAAKNERTSAKDLAEFIGKDQAIANKVLRLANSAYYGLFKEVDSISRAITVIGFNEVTSVTIGMSVINSFQKKDFDGVLDIQDLWLHSITCAMMTKEIASKTRQGKPEQYFLLGLLHDMGKVVFAIYFPAEYRQTLEAAQQTATLLFRKEKEIMGMDHSMLSGLLMDRWNFPDNLINPLKFHHSSFKCDPLYQRQAITLEFSNYLCQKIGIGNGGDPVVPNLEEFRASLRISPSDVKDLISGIKKQRSKIEEFFEVMN